MKRLLRNILGLYIASKGRMLAANSVNSVLKSFLTDVKKLIKFYVISRLIISLVTLVAMVAILVFIIKIF